MTATKKMLLVTDAVGNIVAAAHLGGPQHGTTSVGVVPLPGQTIHEVEVPEALTRLTSGSAFHQALSGASRDPATGRIVFKPVALKKKHP